MSQLELAGIPTIVLGTTAFVEAAVEQWAALGFAQGSYVAVAHPLGSMPLEQVLDEAEKAVGPVLERLLRSAQGAPGEPATAAPPAGQAAQPTARTDGAPSPAAVAPVCSDADGEDLCRID